MQNKKVQLKLFTIKLLFFCLFFVTAAFPLFAQNFSQTIKWSADPNVLEYKVEIQDSTGKIISTVTTEENSINLSLKEGSYKYKITAYDLLGREAVSTQWINFEILRANQPAIVHNQNLEALLEDGKTLEIAVNVTDVTKDTVAELVNVADGTRIKGTLILAESTTVAAATGLTGSENKIANKARFTDVPEGKWKLVITNPSGLSSESQEFEVRDVIKEQKLAAQKAEEERLAREKAEAEERARLAREKEEAERLAKEDEERKAKELGFTYNPETTEEETEETEEDLEAQEEEDEKAKRREKWLTYDRKYYLSGGAGVSIIAYDDGLFNEFTGKTAILSVNGRFDYLPIHTKRIRFGVELNGIGARYSNSNEFYTLDLTVMNFNTDLAFRVAPGKKQKFWFQLKGGGGISIIQEALDYYEDTANNKEDKLNNFGYFSAGGGLSFILIPAQLVTFEVGADFNNLFIPDMNTGIVTPYINLGVRF